MVMDYFVLRSSLIVLLGEPNQFSQAFDRVGCVLRLAFASARVPPVDLCFSPVTKQEFGTKKHSCDKEGECEKHSTKEKRIACCSEKLLAPGARNRRQYQT